MAGLVPAFTDGQHVYLDDDATTTVGAHLTGRVDLAGRLVRVERSCTGWQDRRNWIVRQLHHGRVDGMPVFRFDDEWLFTVVEPLPDQRRQTSN